MATGQPIDALMRLDDRMLVTLRDCYERQWSRTDHLLASIVDASSAAAFNALVGPHVDPKKLRRVRPPHPMPRPGDRTKKRKPTGSELRQVLEPFLRG